MSRSYQLLLPRQLYNDMLAHAESELPNECCGFLGGAVDDDNGFLRALKRYPLVNEASSPIEFTADGKSLRQAHNDMDGCGYQVIAIYHSHPTSPPIPSRTDLERKYITEVVSFIISLSGPEPQIRGWWLSETAYEEASWRIVDA